MTQLSTRLEWELARTKWASQLNPILAMPILDGNQLDDIFIEAATPLAINHYLSRMQQGWILTDNTANAVVWRSQPLNKFTLTLSVSADTVISIWVF